MFQCMHPLKLLHANLLCTEMNFVVVIYVYNGLHQPRSQSSSAILNVTSAVKLHVGEHKGAWNQACYHPWFQAPVC